jgi:uncharacterized phage-associated protein
MAAAIDVARYFIHLASPPGDEDADSLTHMQLQKLLYYAQAWNLAVRGHTLFKAPIEAWTHGPVVREVYPAFAKYRGTGIPPNEGFEPTTMSPIEKSMVSSVWEHYKGYSASALRRLTHLDHPYLEARQGLEPNERSDMEITPDKIRAYFRPKLRDLVSKLDERVDPAMWDATAEAIADGKTRSVEEIRRELRSRGT